MGGIKWFGESLMASTHAPFLFEGWGFQIHLDSLFFVLCIIMAIDYTMGFLIAWKDHNVKSRKMHEGLVRKIGYIALVVAVDVVAGILMKDGRVVRDAVIIGFLLNEFISLLEHINALGIKTPKALDPLLKHLASHSENREENDKKGPS